VVNVVHTAGFAIPTYSQNKDLAMELLRYAEVKVLDDGFRRFFTLCDESKSNNMKQHTKIVNTGNHLTH
jgi:hypothetical protein